MTEYKVYFEEQYSDSDFVKIIWVTSTCIRDNSYVYHFNDINDYNRWNEYKLKYEKTVDLIGIEKFLTLIERKAKIPLSTNIPTIIPTDVPTEINVYYFSNEHVLYSWMKNKTKQMQKEKEEKLRQENYAKRSRENMKRSAEFKEKLSLIMSTGLVVEETAEISINNGNENTKNTSKSSISRMLSSGNEYNNNNNNINNNIHRINRTKSSNKFLNARHRNETAGLF